MIITHLEAKNYEGPKVHFFGANGLGFGGPMVWGQSSWGPIVHIPIRIYCVVTT